jgi:aspartate/methionine/tyrosine aminotransferase
MIPFSLEDFFDCYEHQPRLINLASSDALPWNLAELEDRGVRGDPDTLAYPNALGNLRPALTRFLDLPAGFSILPTSGAAEAIALVMIEHADRTRGGSARETAVPSPAYGAFEGLADLLGLALRGYAYLPSRAWTPDRDEMLALSERCAAVVVTTPHNPTGHIISSDLLQTMARNLAAHDGTLIVDEVFRIPAETPSASSLGPTVITIGSLSKTYGLPGLRLGWIAAAEERIKRLRTVQQYLTLSLSAMTVSLGASVLRNPELFSRAALIHENRRVVVSWAAQHADLVSISQPEGGTTVCLSAVGKAQEHEKALFDNFLAQTVLMPRGLQCFGVAAPTAWFRLGYGGDTAQLRKGLERIITVLKR